MQEMDFEQVDMLPLPQIQEACRVPRIDPLATLIRESSHFHTVPCDSLVKVTARYKLPLVFQTLSPPTVSHRVSGSSKFRYYDVLVFGPDVTYLISIPCSQD